MAWPPAIANLLPPFTNLNKHPRYFQLTCSSSDDSSSSSPNKSVEDSWVCRFGLATSCSKSIFILLNINFSLNFQTISGFYSPLCQMKGCWMVPVNFKVLAKFGLCSSCSQKLHGCSLDRARKIFATARMLAFSLTCAWLLEISLTLLCSFFIHIINDKSVMIRKSWKT